MTDIPLAQRFTRLWQSTGKAAPLSAARDFAVLYEQVHLPVFRYIYGLTGGPQEEVEDLTAETFARAWKARHAFNGSQDEALSSGAALGWLMQIARRLVIDRYRRRMVRGPSEISLPEDLLAPEVPPEQAALAREQRQTLWRLLQTLPNEPREMLVLRYLLGWRVNQIADYLGKPENTVSVTIRRALARLQAAWPEEK